MKVPLTIFPSETVFIDDDFIYAKLLTRNMRNDEGVAITPTSDTEIFLAQGENDFVYLNESNIDGRISKIIELSTEPLKAQKQLTNTVSVIIADYLMPKINGIDFFKRIKSPYIFKILASNFVDTNYSKKTTAAMNEGIINAVLDKKQKFYKTLKQSICKGKNGFFSLISSEILPKPLSKNDKFSDPKLATFVWELVAEINPEYMWANPDLNSFFFKSRNTGADKTLYVVTSDDITDLCQSYQAEFASRKVIERLQSHEFILASEDPFSMDGSQWIELLRPAKKIKGQCNDYLVSLTDGVSLDHQ